MWRKELWRTWFFIPYPIIGNSSRRGSRPFLSPDERPDIERDGSGSSLGGRSTRSGRRDSLSPDSANEECMLQFQQRNISQSTHATFQFRFLANARKTRFAAFVILGTWWISRAISGEWEWTGGPTAGPSASIIRGFEWVSKQAQSHRFSVKCPKL